MGCVNTINTMTTAQDQNQREATPALRKTCATDGTAHFTPAQVAARWGWHVESVRRAIRQRRIEAVVISRRLLVPLGEIVRIETEGRIARQV